MKYLLDTHAFLWFLQNDDSLPVQIRTIIENNKDIYISIVSLWEIAIKLSIKKRSSGPTLTEPPDFI